MSLKSRIQRLEGKAPPRSDTLRMEDLIRICHECHEQGRELTQAEEEIFRQTLAQYGVEWPLKKPIKNAIEIRLCQKVRALYPAEMTAEQSEKFREFCEQQKVTEEMLALPVEPCEERYRDYAAPPVLQYGLRELPRQSEAEELEYED